MLTLTFIPTITAKLTKNETVTLQAWDGNTKVGAMVELPEQWRAGATAKAIYEVEDFGDIVEMTWDELSAREQTYLAAFGIPEQVITLV